MNAPEVELPLPPVGLGADELESEAGGEVEEAAETDEAEEDGGAEEVFIKRQSKGRTKRENG
jgi:hypothetical protein